MIFTNQATRTVQTSAIRTLPALCVLVRFKVVGDVMAIVIKFPSFAITEQPTWPEELDGGMYVIDPNQDDFDDDDFEDAA